MKSWHGMLPFCPTNYWKSYHRLAYISVIPLGLTLKRSQIKAGLTGVTAAIVDTGSLLLLGGPGRPFSASLLPEIHIAVVRESDIYANLNQVLQLAAVKQAPAAILITGPSRTADIEMTLTIGVHGPGELYVICINNG
jgi:L-lactate dehydrogenase complex protein LldG